MNKGFNFNYTTPFYLGKIQGGLNYMQFSSKYKFRPDFQSYFIYAGWLYDFQLINKLSFAPCIKIGNYLMNFDIESQYEKYESEVCIEYSILLKYSLNESVAINLELGKNFVYTYKNIDLILLKTGISFQLETPEFFNGIQE
ncbi:MAG: hypothetical protein K9M80_08415 [Candidatus Marinimicrobia bacterium]|nr:hypothetical protein [Candidatus Neomarinimicrobiota bacterium]